MLDASALMAGLREEAGSAAVEPLLDRAAIGTVDLAEVLGKLVDAGMPEELAWSCIADLGLELVDLDVAQARIMARLRPATRALGLSLGDRACLALAEHLGLPAVTADRSWSGLATTIEIRVVR